MFAQFVLAILGCVIWPDWKGDLVTQSILEIPSIRTHTPPELANDDVFLEYLGVSLEEMKKIWWYRGQMYHQFEISKKNGNKRTINAPDKRLKYLQRRISPLLDQLYNLRNPVHGFVLG